MDALDPLPSAMNRPLLHLLLLLLTTLPTWGQKKPAPKREAGGSNIVTGKTGRRSLVPVNLSVTGLNSRAAAAVTQALEAVTHPIYVCPRCTVRTYRPGTCSHCEGAVEVEPLAGDEVEEQPVYSRIAFSTDRGRLIVTVTPHHWASLREITAIVEKAGGRVLRDRFLVPPSARIKLAHVDARNTRRIRGALVDLGLFKRLIVTADAEGVWIVPLEDGKTTLSQIESVLKKLDPTYAVEDIQWAAYCPLCGTMPVMRMGEPNCRRL